MLPSAPKSKDVHAPSIFKLLNIWMNVDEIYTEYGGSQFQIPEVFPSHKTMFSPFYDLENFFYF